jgi:hypothetical protein
VSVSEREAQRAGAKTGENPEFQEAWPSGEVASGTGLGASAREGAR